MTIARLRLFSLAALLSISAVPAMAQVVSGPARVIDGDTLDFTGTRVVLAGIDAPEAKQTCERDGASWPCGEQAKALLLSMTEHADVACEGTGHDLAGTLVARCRAGETDLSPAMIAAGLAVALPDANETTLDMEQRARKFRLGLWAGTFEQPAAWRDAHPELAPRPAARRVAAAAPAKPRVYQGEWGCAIKGNRSRRGPNRSIPGPWIYHLPGMPHYGETRAEEFFCTEAAAQAAGYRRSRDW